MPITPPSKPAPGPLRLVQDFVNSRDIEAGVELWSTLEDWRAWLRGHGCPADDVEPGDLRDALEIREALRAGLARNNGAEGDGDRGVLDSAARRSGLAVELGDDGARVVARPSGPGGAAVAPVLTAVARAMLDGTWSRMKACRNPACRYAFYDATKNGSGAWCTMRRCGSHLNARAYRARRRTAGIDPAGA